MISVLPLVFCAFSVSLATQVTRTHHRGFGSPVPHSYGSPLPHHTGKYTSPVTEDEAHVLVGNADRSGHWIETDKWDHEHAPWVKRDEVPTSIPTRTHHQSHGSPSPYTKPYTKQDPFAGLEGSKFHRNLAQSNTIVTSPVDAEATSLAEEIYQILDEYEKEIKETPSLSESNFQVHFLP